VLLQSWGWVHVNVLIFEVDVRDKPFTKIFDETFGLIAADTLEIDLE